MQYQNLRHSTGKVNSKVIQGNKTGSCNRFPLFLSDREKAGLIHTFQSLISKQS